MASALSKHVGQLFKVPICGAECADFMDWSCNCYTSLADCEAHCINPTESKTTK